MKARPGAARKATTIAKAPPGTAGPRTKSVKTAKSVKSVKSAKSAKSMKTMKSMKTAKATTHERASGDRASPLIDQRIRELDDWRGETLGRMRTLILEADPGMTEEWKWMGTPVWSHDGIVCTGESYKQVVKLTFLKGASLKDPAGLFNASLDGNARRAIDIREGETIDAAAFKALVREAVALNGAGKGKGARKARS